MNGVLRPYKYGCHGVANATICRPGPHLSMPDSFYPLGSIFENLYINKVEIVTYNYKTLYLFGGCTSSCSR